MPRVARLVAADCRLQRGDARRWRQFAPVDVQFARRVARDCGFYSPRRNEIAAKKAAARLVLCRRQACGRRCFACRATAAFCPPTTAASFRSHRTPFFMRVSPFNRRSLLTRPPLARHFCASGLPRYDEVFCAKKVLGGFYLSRKLRARLIVLLFFLSCECAKHRDSTRNSRRELFDCFLRVRALSRRRFGRVVAHRACSTVLAPSPCACGRRSPPQDALSLVATQPPPPPPPPPPPDGAIAAAFDAP